MKEDFRIGGVKRLLHLGRRQSIGRTIDEEIEFHLASRIDDLVRAGHSREEARRLAEQEFGDRETARRELAQVDQRIEARARRASWREGVAQDLRYAVRSLVRRRGFTLAALATIALGIGFTTSIFSIVDGVLLRPLPFREPDRLVRLSQIFTKWKGDPVLGGMWDKIPFGVDEFEKLRDHNTVFESVGVWGNTSFTLSEGGRTEIIAGTYASPSLLHVLDVRPLRGAVWAETDDVPGGPKVALVGYEEWQGRHGGADSVLGSLMHFGRDAYRIIGILPPGFRLELADAPVNYLVPIGQEEGDRNRNNRSYFIIGRLAPGVTHAQAELQAKAILDQADAGGTPKTVRLSDWHVEQTRDSRTALFLLLGAVGLLLAIACINVATLMLGEASAREQEIAARMAIGAERLRLIQQLLTESLVLSVTGSALGALIAIWGTKLFVSIAPPRIPGLAGVHVDYRVLVFAAGLSIITGLLFGLAPSLQLASLRPTSLMRGSGQSVAGRGRLQGVLVAGQLGLSVVLLVCSGLLVKSLLNLTSTDPGFRADHMIVARLVLPPGIGSDTARRRVFFESAIARVAALPGVEAVSASSSTPFDGSYSSSSVTIVGAPAESAPRPHDAQQRTVQPGYFAFMGTPIVAGRAFTPEDRGDANPVMIVNEAFARREMPGGGVLGTRVKYQSQTWTIIGVARDTRFRRLATPPEPMIYVPAGVFEGRFGSLRALLVRTKLDPADMVPTVRKAITSMDGGPAITSIRTMDDRVRESFAEERFRTMLISVFGALAALLAAVGLYGVTARAVSRRTREVGIRVALGASRGGVVRLMLRSTLVGASIGVGSGLIASAGASRLIAGYLYDVNPRDPATYGAIIVFLAVVALVASFIPARRAASVHPAAVLRGE